MTSLATILPNGRKQFLNPSTGAPLAGGQVFYYVPGTTTLQTTWQDSGQVTQNQNPVTLDAAGSSVVYGTGQYREYVLDSLGNLISDSITSDTGIISAVMAPVIGAATMGAALATLGSIASFSNIAALRQNLTVQPSVVWVSGYYAGADGGEGLFWLNAADTLTADNGGTVIVDAAGNRWYRETTGQPVSVKWFGAVGDGTTDDTGAFQAALATMTAGGTVAIPSGYTFKIGNITIPVGVTLHGPYGMIGAPGLANFSPPYSALSGLRLTPSSTITVNGGACIDGVFIAPTGMTFPQTTTASFAGTAITAAGDDVTLRNSMIMGFAMAVTSTGFSRIRIRDCNLDNLANIYISGSMDVCHLSNIQCWPFATIQQGGLGANLQRSGAAYELSNCNDDTKIIGCFSYGYAVGFYISSCDSVQLIGCAADNTQTYGFGIGFNIVGGSTDTTLVACQASAQYIGFYLTTTVVAHIGTRLTNCDAWGNTNHGMLIDTAALGDVTIIGGIVRNSPNGISIASAVPIVDIDLVRFDAIVAETPILLTVTTTNLRIGPMCNFGLAAAGSAAATASMGVQSVASASDVALPATGNVFTVTGTASIGTLGGGYAGREVTLVASGSMSFLSSTGATSAMRLSGGITYAATAGGTLKLMHNGNQWYETGRCT